MILTKTNKRSNIFVSFLQFLNVKHTHSYASRYFEVHPHKNNLFGLSRMLSDYGVKNAGLKIEDKEAGLQPLETPFIAHLGQDFVTVYKLSAQNISYIWRGEEVSTSIEEFNKVWSGVILVAEPSADSIEPNYKENRQKELIDIVQKYLLFFSVAILSILLFFSNDIYNRVGTTLLLITNLVGVYVGYLLILKQMHIQSDYADKICSLFKKGDCNDVLDSPAAKFMGIIGWSEIGLSYFISNVLVILLLPQLIPFLALVNICALPYTVWSVWYQKFKAKQWCPLCLIVQALLWISFFTSLIFGLIQAPAFTITNVLLIGCMYAIPFFTISISLPKLIEGRKVKQVIQEIGSLKMKDEVFIALLKTQTHHQVEKQTSQILFGNSQAGTLITVFTNPHCNPCSRMHKRIEKLLDEVGDKICIQYIFSSFSKELESSNRILISAFLNNDTKTMRTIYNEWFEWGRNRIGEFVQKYNIDINAPGVDEEVEAHRGWRNKSKMGATPTILVEGYELDRNYKIEDLKYFTALNLK